MPDHYTNHLLIISETDEDGSERPDWDAILRPYHGEDAINLFDEIFPMPQEVKDAPSQGANPLWLRWANENWGTKWGVYDASDPVALPGDTPCRAWTFLTAWNPPHEQMRQRVIEWFKSRGAKSVTWLGVVPYDKSVRVLKVR